MSKCILIVIDSLGVGEAPDAENYGDIGANTFGNVAKANGQLNLPTFEKLGFGAITNINGLKDEVTCSIVGKLAESSKGNDSTTGHWEIGGLITQRDFSVFPKGFPSELIDKISSETGHEFIGNYHASGTEIINELGEEHLSSGKLILYTSGDSVFQIAAHEKILSVNDLYKICKISREYCNEYNIGRVIARPFIGDKGNFQRTYDRKDFGITPPGETILSQLFKYGKNSLGIGKISDLFGDEFLSNSIHTEGDKNGLEILISEYEDNRYDFYFINLVDLDMLYGHREDPAGYYDGLKIIDNGLDKLISVLNDDDIIIITGDHGTDPTDGKTDHSREYVPFIIYKNNLKPKYIGEGDTFSDIAATISDIYEIENIFPGKSSANHLSWLIETEC